MDSSKNDVERVECVQIDDGVWGIAGEVRLLPGFFLPARATVIRLEDGSLWVHSPVALGEAVASELDRLGPVAHLVAPNNLHHLFIAPWRERWPQAQMVGARGLRKKRPDLDFSATLDENVQWPGLERTFIEGAPALGESVFFHRPSKTLLVTDLIFNLGPHNTRGWMTPWFLRLVGVWDRPMQSRLLRTATKDRAKAGDSIQRILDWPFERVVMAHGDVIEEDAKAVFTCACHWMLDASTLEPAPQRSH